MAEYLGRGDDIAGFIVPKAEYLNSLLVDKVNVNQGIGNVDKILGIDSSGIVVPVDTPQAGIEANSLVFGGDGTESSPLDIVAPFITFIPENDPPVAVIKDLPWCEGYFQDRSLVASVFGLFTPIITDGDISMISGNRFVATERGRYVLSISGGVWSQVTTSNPYCRGWVLKNADVLVDSSNAVGYGISVITMGSYNAVINCPDINVVSISLEYGEYLTHFMQVSAARTSLNADGAIHNFCFARIA